MGSSEARRHRRRKVRGAQRVYTTYACTADNNAVDIEAAKKASHDRLLELVRIKGLRRTTGVKWRLIDPSHRDRLLDQYQNNGQQSVGGAEEWAAMRQWFVDNPRGWLIVAMCNIA